MARIYAPGIRYKLPRGLRSAINTAAAIEQTPVVNNRNWDNPKWITPFWGANSRKLMAWSRMNAWSKETGFRPFSCRINVSGEISWVTITDVMMPDKDDTLGEPLLRYVSLDKYADRMERQIYTDRLRDTGLFSIEYLAEAPFYELQKLAEHMERFAF